jgi:hypothetical protein
LVIEEGLGVRNLLRFNHALFSKWLWLDLRERLGGEWWWIQNMEVNGECGVLMSILGRMGKVNGRILGGVGEVF